MQLAILSHGSCHIDLELVFSELSKFLDRKIYYSDVSYLSIDIINDDFACALKEEREDYWILYDYHSNQLVRSKGPGLGDKTVTLKEYSEDEFWSFLV